MHKYLEIRQESSSDFTEISELIRKEFLQFDEKPSEPQLVINLRNNEAHVPKLCVVAVIRNKVVGHIFYTNLKLKHKPKAIKFLALAPVSVLPEYQGKGIGSILIKETISEARSLGYGAIILVGHAKYYSRFGFKKLSSSKLKLPFEVPDENAMILELSTEICQRVTGILQYDKAFMA